MTINRIPALLALSFLAAGRSFAFAAAPNTSGLNRAESLSAAAAESTDDRSSALLASAALDGRGLDAATASAVARRTSAVRSGLSAPGVTSGSRDDVKVPSPISWMNHPRPAAKPGFMHRFTRTGVGELLFLGLVGFAIATACMFGGAVLAVAALGPGNGLAGGLLGAIGGFFVASKVTNRLEK